MKESAKQLGKVAVLMGGQGSEREISLMSGNGVLTALQNSGIDAYPVDVGSDICERLLKENYDRAFIALHGTHGEDGTMQGMLEYLKIPYTGSGVLSSALAMDKEKTKLIWQALGIPTLPFAIVDEDTTFAALEQKLGLPLVIKPTCEGSSMGVSRVTTSLEFLQAKQLARQYNTKIMAEPWLDETEVTIGILADKPLPIIRIKTPIGFYDYEAKYFSDVTEYHIPSGLPLELEDKIQKLSLEAYQALNCSHWGRVDAILDKNNQIWFLEVNTIPGLTSHSLVPKAAKAVGISYEELVLRILQQTL